MLEVDVGNLRLQSIKLSPQSQDSPDEGDDLNAFMEQSGAASPGVLVLITGLSKPFRRLHKYSAMLQELERHMELSDPDRGDTQRGVAVYKDIDSVCSATRKQKELQLQVLTGPVRGWQGQPVTSLGDIIHMSCVSVGPDQKDRFLVLFPSTILFLSVSQRMSAFIYEGKLPLAGKTITRIDDSEFYKNVFEIDGPLIEKIMVTCKSSGEADKWVELLNAHGSSVKCLPPSASSLSITPKPPHMPPLTPQSSSSRCFAPAKSPPAKSPDLPMYQQRSHSFNHHQSFTQYANETKPPINNQNKNLSAWKSTNMGSYPPPPSNNSLRQQSRSAYEDGDQVFRAFETYYTPNAASNNNTAKGDSTDYVNEVTLKSLMIAVSQMQSEMVILKKQIQEERQARILLQNQIRNQFLATGPLLDAQEVLDAARETKC
ncbi:rho guanine nucleotide exchange factor 7-like [Ctenocephalides felis]|uniref:rho guanine nucleotide exchange factor 7-like n=1 Tax=Ctenocephalides felis TaxID=7515 RepID=UPI000E6E2D0E|nr:rho guanine nucleotide exchange factor 7-like [Ctenocephalides felis]